MSWLRRLSRDRTSKSEHDNNMPNFRSSTSYDDTQGTPPFRKDTQYSPQASQDMLSYRRSIPLQDSHGNNTPQRQPGSSDATMMHGGGVGVGVGGGLGGGSIRVEPTPDPLARAFNEAIKPYVEQIESMDGQMADLHLRIQQLEDERSEIHSWIDKRGFRPDVPPHIAKAMDAQPDSAQTLNFQLDRKMTMVNYDLHRLQDALNDALSPTYFVQALATLVPDLERLAALPAGAKFAFELVLKLAGNLNSHGGAAPSTPDDSAEFYERLDEVMVEVVRKRVSQGEEWAVQRDVRRMEKTAGYLRSYNGVEGYFPRSLRAMVEEVHGRNGGQGGGGGRA